MGLSLKGILAGGISEAVKTVSDVVDKYVDTPTEKAQRDLEIQKIIIDQQNKQADLAQQELDSYLKDVQSSRDMNTRIQESEKSSWLAKNAGYIIDGIVLTAFISTLIMMSFKLVPQDNKDLFNMGFGALLSYVGYTIQWHRGSSSGSKASGDVLRTLAKTNQP